MAREKGLLRTASRARRSRGFRVFWKPAFRRGPLGVHWLVHSEGLIDISAGEGRGGRCLPAFCEDAVGVLHLAGLTRIKLSACLIGGARWVALLRTATSPAYGRAPRGLIGSPLTGGRSGSLCMLGERDQSESRSRLMSAFCGCALESPRRLQAQLVVHLFIQSEGLLARSAGEGRGSMFAALEGVPSVFCVSLTLLAIKVRATLAMRTPVGRRVARHLDRTRDSSQTSCRTPRNAGALSMRVA